MALKASGGLLNCDGAVLGGVEVVVVFVGAGSIKSEGDCPAGGDIAKIEGRIVGMGGVGSGGNVASSCGFVGPHDGGANFDGDSLGSETG